MALPFLPPQDQRLVLKSDKIPVREITSDATKKDIDEMLTVAYGNQGDTLKKTLVGLAANQIGIMKRIILVDTGADGRGHVSHLRAFINPEIVWKSSEQSEWYEGCYSTGQITGIVRRPRAVRVHAYTPDGREITEKHAGYVGRIFQHEIDHLDGKFFIDLISDDRDLHIVKPDEFAQYRNERGWSDWPRKATRAQWEALKSKSS